MIKAQGKVSGGVSAPPEPAALLAIIETFVAACAEPALVEYGEEIAPLLPGEYALEVRAGRLWVEVWSESRSISRRILSIEKAGIGVLDCTVHRFGGKPGKLCFLDAGRPQTAHKALSGKRQSFSEQFRRMLSRQFPGWEIVTLSCGMDLQRSFSPVFPRALVARGNQRIAAMACPNLVDEAALLTFALLWHEHVRANAPQQTHVTLSLFLPDRAGNLTAHRLRWLTAKKLEPRLFRFNAQGSAGEVDPQDLGNLETKVSSHYGPSQKLLGSETKHEVTASHTRAFPERWLESCVRANLAVIDSSLLHDPVHGQVLTFAAGDRDLIDLLAVSSSGRLAVLELKASEDLHLPIQALDYWMRIAWHAQAGELQHLFPEVPLDPCPPRLLLVAPAMCFHSSNAVILSYFSSAIDVERIGVNSDWQHNLRVVLRLKGAHAPISHRSS